MRRTPIQRFRGSGPAAAPAGPSCRITPPQANIFGDVRPEVGSVPGAGRGGRIGGGTRFRAFGNEAVIRRLL
jgi:hypothetical protein